MDSNVVMYAAGVEHSNKAPAVRVLNQVSLGELNATVDAEVLQEIIHRYRALNRREEGRRVYSLTRSLFPNVLPVTGEVMDRASILLDRDNSLSTRDAVHAAVVIVYGLEGILTFDLDFDRVPGCKRLPLE